MTEVTACALCTPMLHVVLYQDDFCRVVLLNDADYPAYCRVELVEHIKEMTDLAPLQRARMMKTVFAVETALREMLNPDKINLASLGNKTPHIHWHVIPRFENDKHFPNSHWGDAARDSNAVALDEITIKKLSEKVSSLVECALNSATA
ncbi:HIT family protein [Methylotenera sp.]|uniref:HIT family protein n=1 Tax=Methylotenera sp. TaxID=2051956 RepID=UPI0024881FFA|nr:HIT family protein [Methylotenera sp.]MDI1360739.1 HIT family protein [Methylotenera sp.]